MSIRALRCAALRQDAMTGVSAEEITRKVQAAVANVSPVSSPADCSTLTRTISPCVISVMDFPLSVSRLMVRYESWCFDTVCGRWEVCSYSFKGISERPVWMRHFGKLADRWRSTSGTQSRSIERHVCGRRIAKL